MISLKKLGRFPAVLLIFSIASLPISVAYAQDESTKVNPSLESKLEQLTTSVYCYCGCTRETIQHCVCGNAQGVEDEFRKRLAAGGAVEQIRNDYIAAHGTEYSALMPAEGFNIVAYAVPAIILVLLLGVVVFVVLKLKSGSQLAPRPVSTEQQPSVDRYKQIEEELEHYKQQR